MVSDHIRHEVKKLHIGKKIRELRKKGGLILQDLSDRTGLSKPLAKRRMLVLFHGATPPTGLSRTFPNVLGYEAVRGLEYDKFNEQGSPPPHEVTIPCTRMLAGPMDFTPGAMRARSKATWKAVHDLPFSQGTVARQLAMYVMYETSLPMLSDMPTAYERNPDALDLLKAVPTTWDETLGLDGRIGQWALIARKKGDQWWLAAMTDWYRRRVEVPLSFLGLLSAPLIHPSPKMNPHSHTKSSVAHGTWTLPGASFTAATRSLGRSASARSHPSRPFLATKKGCHGVTRMLPLLVSTSQVSASP